MKGRAQRPSTKFVRFDYCRGKQNVSSHSPIRLWITLASLAAAAIPALAQCPTETANPDKNAPRLRAVAVLEWTGDEDHPKTSRLVPVSILDGQSLEDAGVYKSQPEPLALQDDVEYQLQQDGKPVGFFDVKSVSRQLGTWYGLGKWKPLPTPKQAPAQAAKIDEDDVQSDVPVLHRKHPAAGSGSSGADSAPSVPAPAPDPDRPTLHKSGDASTTGDAAGNSTSASAGGSSSPDSASDPDRPTLHKSSGSSSTTAPVTVQSPKDDVTHVDNVAAFTDPERPRLVRGKVEDALGPVLPTLIGLPPDMKQAVAVSDLRTQPAHPWDYSWANPGDEAKMKAAMEDLARTALGLSPATASPAPHAKPASKTASAHKPTRPAPTPEPAPLAGEQFRVFELAYGSGATMVLSARTDDSKGPAKFVTLIAQPDLYGGVAVLVKNVTDAAHLDDTPRWRLVDAVDALADNRGDLLFELRGATERQFALYRVLRGQATRIFVGSSETIAAAPSSH